MDRAAACLLRRRLRGRPPGGIRPRSGPACLPRPRPDRGARRSPDATAFAIDPAGAEQRILDPGQSSVASSRNRRSSHTPVQPTVPEASNIPRCDATQSLPRAWGATTAAQHYPVVVVSPNGGAVVLLV